MNTRILYRRAVRGALFVTIFAVGCTNPAEPTASPQLSVLAVDGAIFVSLTQVDPISLTALHDDVVEVAADGCVRSAGTEPYTMLWPVGFTLENRDDHLVVVRDSGAPVGTLGDRFTFGGGETGDLSGDLGLSESDVALLRARCPGLYWLVGMVP